MTSDEFTRRLTVKFPEFLNKSHQAELVEIEDAVKGYYDKDIDLIWAEFRDTWDANYPPRRAKFIKLISSLGLARKMPQSEYEQLCYPCCAAGREYLFPLECIRCPRCSTKERPLLAITLRGAHINQDKAQAIVNKFPTGPHPTMAVKMPVMNEKLKAAVDRREPYANN